MNNDLYAMRHSSAHVLATAINELWPGTQFGVGPVVENGFYYDVLLPVGSTIKEEDLQKVESKMRDIVSQDQVFEHSTKKIDEAIAWAKEYNQDFKTELLNDLKREGTTVAKDLDASAIGTITEGSGEVEEVGFYTNGNFEDLCRGPHVESTGKIGAFKLLRLAGAYWRGDETKTQMQRVYGVAFETQAELDDYLAKQALAKERDHRKLGQELDLFVYSEQIGSGLPLFTPRGTVLRELLGQYSQQLRKEQGFEKVWIPHITKKNLYETSGHWDKFGDELFLVKSQETSDELVMKPMNCPHHTQIFASQQRSYKDLPIKYMENTTVYRDEKSGELHGLSRVRSITQDDSHAFCMPQQIEEVVSGLIASAKEIYEACGMDLKFRLSFKDDGKGYLGEESLWQDAQKQLEEIAKKNELEYFVEAGEAAFYGPKIDFIAVDSLDREWQVATIQLDFVQPERFKLEYTGEDGSKKTPVMIHSALLGSIERYLSVFIEHVDGRFPFWLCPEQVRIITVNDKVTDYVTEISEVLSQAVLMKPLKYNELRFGTDARSESLGKKIREAEKMKVPVILIVGPKDMEARQVSVRAGEVEEKVQLDELVGWLDSYSAS